MFASIWIKLIGLAAIAAVILSAYLYVHHQTVQIEALRADKAQADANAQTAENAAKSSASALAAEQRQSAADLAALSSHYQAAAAIERRKTIILEGIDNAPQSDDGSVAPVLAHALDCLRDKAGSAAGAGCAFREGNPTGGTAGLPAKP